MKRKIIIFLMVIGIVVIFSAILVFSEQKYDFRKTNWGMSKEQVKATEDKKPDIEDDNELGYKVRLIEVSKYLCKYYFLENKLYQSIYFLDEKYTDKKSYIDNYKLLKEILIEKYGEPKIDEVAWQNNFFKDDELTTAVFIRDLTYGTVWETLTTNINLTLLSSKYMTTLGIGYHSKELKEWADKILEERVKSEF